MVKETRRRAPSDAGSDATLGPISQQGTTLSSHTESSSLSRPDTMISGTTVFSLFTDDFTQLTLREIRSRPSSPYETAHEHTLHELLDDPNPEIFDAAKTTIRQWLEEVQQHQIGLTDVEAELQGLKKREAKLESQITASKETTRQAKRDFDKQCQALIKAATANENVSTNAREHLQAKVDEQSTREIVAAAREIQTELTHSIRPKHQEKARLKKEVHAIDALITPDDEIEVITRDYQAEANVRQRLENHHPDRTPTQGEIDRTLAYERRQDRERYEPARLHLREQLNIDGLFEEMGKRQADPPDYPPSLEELPPEIHGDVKHILDHMWNIQETREQYEEIIDQQHILPLIPHEIQSEAPFYHALKTLQIEQQPPNETAEAFHQRLMDSLPRDVPKHIQQTDHWQQLHLTYDDYNRKHQRTPEHYAEQQARGFAALQQMFLEEDPANLADRKPAISQIEQRQPNETVQAYHQRLVSLLPHDTPGYIQTNDYWQRLHMTYSDYLQIDPPHPEIYVLRKQEALRSLKDFLQDRNQLLRHLQRIERWRRAEQDLLHIQQEIVSILTAHLPDYPPEKFPPEIQTKIENLQHNEQLISNHLEQTVRSVQEIGETEAPTYVALQKLTEQQALQRMMSAYHQQILNFLPNEVPEHIQQTEQWQRLHLTYHEYIRNNSQARSDTYVHMMQEALRNLQLYLQGRNQDLPSVRLAFALSGLEHSSDLLTTIQNIKAEESTYLALQQLTEQQALHQMMNAYHWQTLNFLPTEVPEHIQQTDHWQQLQMTYDKYIQSHPQARPDAYVHMKQEALRNLQLYLQGRNQLSTHLKDLLALREEHQEALKNIQWSRENWQAETILSRLSTPYGSNANSWSTFRRSLRAYLANVQNAQAIEEPYWDNIARKGKEISQKKTAQSELDQALLQAHDTHPLYRERERISDRQYQTLQNVATFTGIPPEQQRALREISADSTRTLLERYTNLEETLSARREQLQSRIATLKHEIAATQATSRIATRLIAITRSQKERVTAHKHTEETLRQTQEDGRKAETRRTGIGQEIATAQAHITATRERTVEELDSLIAQQRNRWQHNRNKREASTKATEETLSKGRYKTFLKSLEAKKKQLAEQRPEFERTIRKSEQTLRSLDQDPKYSRDRINQLQSEIDDVTASNNKDFDNIQKFAREHGLPTDDYRLSTGTLATDLTQTSEATIKTLEDMFTQAVRDLDVARSENFRLLTAVNIRSYFTENTLSDEDRRKSSAAIRAKMTANPTYKSNVQAALRSLFQAVGNSQVIYKTFIEILKLKKEKSDHFYAQAEQSKEEAEQSKATLEAGVANMEEEKKGLDAKRSELRQRVKTPQQEQKEEEDRRLQQEEEDKRFQAWLERINKLKAEILSLYRS